MATGLTGPSGQASFHAQSSPAESGSWLSGNLPDAFFSDSELDDQLTLTGREPAIDPGSAIFVIYGKCAQRETRLARPRQDTAIDRIRAAVTELGLLSFFRHGHLHRAANMSLTSHCATLMQRRNSGSSTRWETTRLLRNLCYLNAPTRRRYEIV